MVQHRAEGQLPVPARRTLCYFSAVSFINFYSSCAAHRTSLFLTLCPPFSSFPFLLHLQQVLELVRGVVAVAAAVTAAAAMQQQQQQPCRLLILFHHQLVIALSKS